MMSHNKTNKRLSKSRSLIDLKRALQPIRNWVGSSLWHRAVAILLATMMIGLTFMYGLGQWYIWKHRNDQLNVGVTFIPRYARYYGLDAEDTMKAIINDLGIRRFRLVSYWDEIERTQDTYNFDELDWQFKLAEESDAKISLAIGLRQPRWPECHMPDWAEYMNKEIWTVELKDFMKAVIERYRNSPALESYQLENEFFMKVFGICPDHSRDRLIDEYNFVKELDKQHPFLIARSNNWVGLPLGDPRPDGFAISVYKRVWDKAITKRYFEYPMPAWFYASLAGGAELMTGKNMVIHELQAEAWLPEGYQMNDVNDIPEQNKSMNPERLKHRIGYGVATGMKTIDLWGVEWWYWRKVVANDPELWETAKTELQKVNQRQ